MPKKTQLEKDKLELSKIASQMCKHLNNALNSCEYSTDVSRIQMSYDNFVIVLQRYEKVFGERIPDELETELKDINTRLAEFNEVNERVLFEIRAMDIAVGAPGGGYEGAGSDDSTDTIEGGGDSDSSGEGEGGISYRRVGAEDRGGGAGGGGRGYDEAAAYDPSDGNEDEEGGGRGYDAAAAYDPSDDEGDEEGGSEVASSDDEDGDDDEYVSSDEEDGDTVVAVDGAGGGYLGAIRAVATTTPMPYDTPVASYTPAPTIMPTTFPFTVMHTPEAQPSAAPTTTATPRSSLMPTPVAIATIVPALEAALQAEAEIPNFGTGNRETGSNLVLAIDPAILAAFAALLTFEMTGDSHSGSSVWL